MQDVLVLKADASLVKIMDNLLIEQKSHDRSIVMITEQLKENVNQHNFIINALSEIKNEIREIKNK